MKIKTFLPPSLRLDVGRLMITLYSCLNTSPRIAKPNPAFVKYISGYSSGMISRNSTIRIELAHPVGLLNGTSSQSQLDSALAVNDANNAVFNYDRNSFLTTNSFSGRSLPDSSLLKDAFTFEPYVKGKAVWINDRVIEFIPAQPLESNQFYNIEFKLKNVAKVASNLEYFPFQIATYPQNMFVEMDGLRNYDDYNIEWQKLTGKITTSDFVDTTTLKKTIQVSLNGKLMPVKISESYNNIYYFYVDSIERKKTAQTLKIQWNAAAIKGTNFGAQEIAVPALGDFYVTDAKVVDDGDQYISLSFSDPIQSSQNLKGIITVQDVSNLTYSIQSNVVKVFLPNRIIGNKAIAVTTGIKNFKGYKMNTAYSSNLYFEEPKPLVRIKGKGSILPNSNGLIFPFEAVSLKSVNVRISKIFTQNVHQFLQVNNLDGRDELTRVAKVIVEKKVMLNYKKDINLKQWNTHVIDLATLINPDPGAIYRISIKFSKEDAICDCAAEEGENQNDQSQSNNERDEWNESYWGRYSYDDGYSYWYDYGDDYSPCNDYYYYGKAVSRNILASNIGVIYKQDETQPNGKEGRYTHAFVNDMLTTKPIAGAVIEYYDYTKQLIGTGTTDANGMLDLYLKNKPFLLIAKHDKQRGYLKLLDAHTNSLSKFDVEGEVVQKGVKGFIYTERGVWRPGDSIYVNFIIEDKEKRLPDNHPVKFELHNPSGQVVYQVTKTKNVNGTYDFRTNTSSEAPTGNYMALVKVGNRQYSQTLKIETVKPNRLKIYFDFATQKINDSLAKLSVKWLHGAVAKKLHTLVNVNVNQATTSFAKYKAYVFDSPIRSFASNNEVVFDGDLNEKGETMIKSKLNVGNTAPGMLKATYVTKVFEEGGDYSIDKYTVPYSPFKTYVGLYCPETKNYDNTLETGKKYKFDVVTLNENGEAVNTPKLQVKIYRMQWRWWYERDNEDLIDYISRAGTIPVKDTLISTKNGKSSFDFGINLPEYGRYLITVTDLVGGHQTGRTVSIDWPYWSRSNRTSNENANMLNFSCDKEKYVTGEKIKLSFPSPADGMALVSVESGSKVVKKFWIETKKGETIHEFVADAEMCPNAYVHVTMIQPHANTKNDLPIRMYGVVPVIVDNPATHLAPVITMPEVVKPETYTIVKVKEQNGKKMTYTLAVVDEGLLDLTRYKTPQPWNTFYAREALGVKTWDMYDDVIGAFSGKLDKLLSIGGDGGGDAGKSLKANRFKPMVRHLGPFTLEAGQEKTHKIEIPNYIGSVKVMVVAQNDGAYGSAEKTVAVKKPLMLLATLPRVLGPGETVYLPVNIFAMEKHVKDVKINVEVNDFLTIDGAKTQGMIFKEPGDEVINYKLIVAQKVGIAKVKITAICGNEKAVQEIELDVRTPNPKVVDAFEMAIEPNKDWQSQINFTGITGTNKVTVELSSIPSLGLEKRLDYLIQYPHGCIEQTTSSVFPQLFVSNLIEMKNSQKEQIAHNIKAGIKRLQLFQTANGGFSYWPGEGEDSEWGSNYAGHFIIEAEKQGYTLPGSLKQRWVKYQQQQARNWNNAGANYTHPHGSESNQVMQAYRLFVLALSNNAELGAMNRLREEKNLSTTAKWRLAAAYKLVGQKDIALKLIEGLQTTVASYKELSYSYGSDYRDVAMILETLSLLGEKSKANIVAQQVTKNLNSKMWMSTQETAYSLLAMCVYTGANSQNAEMKFAYGINGETAKTANSKKTVVQLKYSEKEIASKSNLLLTNTGSTTLFAKIMVEGIPLIGDKTAKSSNLQMQIVYKDMKGKIIQPTKIAQGTDFVAEVKITNPGAKGYLKEMALNQIFPSGWEIHNARLFGESGKNEARYQDIRDDRVYSYYDLQENNTKTFTIQLNATYLGRFYLPTIYSEAMYDNTINARIPGQWVEVVKEIENVAVK